MAKNPTITQLDGGQVIKRVYDEANDAFRMEIPSGLSLTVTITDSADSIAIGNGLGTLAQVTGANALKVDGSAVTQPVSGTVTSNIGTTNGLALDSTLGCQSTFTTGAKSSIGGTAVQLTTSSVACKKGVTIKSINTNTAIVYVGSSSGVTAGSADSTDGFALDVGETITIEVDNANKVYLISSGSQKVSWAAL